MERYLGKPIIQTSGTESGVLYITVNVFNISHRFGKFGLGMECSPRFEPLLDELVTFCKTNHLIAIS